MRKSIILLCLSLCITNNASAQSNKTIIKNDKWERVLKAQPIIDGKGDISYDAIKSAQAHCNKFISDSDLNIWGVSDYWATPKEFAAKGAGDCEDFSVCKYYALREAGFAAKDLKIVIGIHSLLNTYHSVLSVKFKGEDYVLDSMKDEIFTRDDYFARYFTPIYEVNEDRLDIY